MNCIIITCIKCIKSYELYKQEQCDNCSKFEWIIFKTEELCNEEYKKQFPEQFNEKGIYKENLPKCNKPLENCQKFSNHGFSACPVCQEYY